MENWIWIAITVAALVLPSAFHALSRKGRKNWEMSRRAGKGMMEDFDEEQSMIDKYSQ